MADLNVRNFPEELLRSLKTQAAADGSTLREIVIARLQPAGVPMAKPARTAPPLDVAGVTLGNEIQTAGKIDSQPIRCGRRYSPVVSVPPCQLPAGHTGKCGPPKA